MSRSLVFNRIAIGGYAMRKGESERKSWDDSRESLGLLFFLFIRIIVIFGVIGYGDIVNMINILFVLSFASLSLSTYEFYDHWSLS